jgi:hypothetical protein
VKFDSFTKPITVAAQSEACTEVYRSSKGGGGGVPSETPTQSMDICVHFSVFVLSCVGSRGLATG